MAIKLSFEQEMECIRAIADVMYTGKTKRVCPVCKGELKTEIYETSGETWCKDKDCFEHVTIRGI
nr:MAG TPA: PADR1 domain protein [Caudoviricetes sp.]